MSRKPKDNRPYIPPVKRIELSEGNTTLRWIVIVILVIVGALAITSGLNEALVTQPGWTEVEAVCDQINCASEFKLVYDLTDYGSNAGAANNQLTEIYSDACEKAYLIFSPDVEGQGNVYSLNNHVNQTITVDPVLYRALETLNRYENRSPFFAPVNVEYNRVFLSATDAEAALYDPQKDAETGEYVQMLLPYLSDANQIRIELSEGDKATLVVSDAYLDFAEAYGIELFFDFGWMKNAFIADYLADALLEQGFTQGYLNSYDGFTRNLDNREGDYSISLFDRMGDTIHVPAQLHYQGPKSIVFLRDFPVTQLDQWRFYAYEDGSIASVLLNTQTGKPTASVASMISVSEKQTCAQILMEIAPSFLAETFSKEQVNSLKEIGISTVWCQNGSVFKNDADLSLTLLDTGKQAGYQIITAE